MITPKKLKIALILLRIFGKVLLECVKETFWRILLCLVLIGCGVVGLFIPDKTINYIERWINLSK